ncbi:MAG: class I SAM-dependent methyltransferase [Bacteroidetes bacterium]|nr:class I SAM-dependent methyltransferase [Bacteroidota bacterium]
MNSDFWFKDWFNSKYYHLLYNKRDDNEAGHFINGLCEHLHLAPSARVWDLACGKGRHTIAFAKKGFKVTGTDLSKNSIKEAIEQNETNVDFFIHDMRRTFRINYFDCVVNLFTSIGYFDNYKDNFTVFSNVHSALKPGGLFVVDFFNSEKVKKTCVSEYTEQREGITFHINKEIIDNVIRKKIAFEANSQQHTFTETVSLLQLNDFEKFAEKSNLKLQNVFGNYSLEPFNADESERLILIFKK